MMRELDIFKTGMGDKKINGHTAPIKEISFIQVDSQEDHATNKSLLLFRNCLIDTSGRQFACIHGECQTHENCIKKELSGEEDDLHCLHFHPDDQNVLCTELFPEILKFMISIPTDELPGYRFSFNHRYIRKDGSITQFLQEGTFSLSDNKHSPVLNLQVFTEIGELKSDDTMVLAIHKYDPDHGYQKVFSNSYRKKTTPPLSQRQLEIIRLCLEGLSSKMIADKLNISIHTVKNHKRNCMEKTCTRNIAELINTCLKNNWL
jgi:DNA-binding CsgD family transcriptional regulator